MVFNHSASLVTARFLQRFHEASKEALTRSGLYAFNNSISGGTSGPIRHGIHQVFPSRKASADILALRLETQRPGTSPLHNDNFQIFARHNHRSAGGLVHTRDEVVQVFLKTGLLAHFQS